MSLINDMLKDLERHKPSPVDNNSSARKLKSASSSLTNSKVNIIGLSKYLSVKALLLPTVALLFVVYFLVSDVDLVGVMPDSNADFSVPSAISIDSGWLEVTSSLLANREVSPEPIVVNKVDLLSDSPPKLNLSESAVEEEKGNTSAIRRLLDEANMALDNNQFTTPVKHNAFQLFQSVLVLDPKNTLAEEGVKKIHKAYVRLLDQAFQNRDGKLVYSYAQRARDVGVSENVIHQFQMNGNDASKIVDDKRSSVPIGNISSSGISVVDTGSEDQYFAETLKLREQAGMYQSKKMFDLAIPIYGRLVDRKTQNSNDWLGFAVSLDAQGQYPMAKTAYRKVIQLKHSNKRVMDFSQQRINAL